ncbi:MAG: hypothetical protein KatS3mg003_1496 [Candidatus Nitrosocaldaceae archaeon]|nr:MAG: hypothetical protein KatS3mg003_1496 [Candidatus Nitrosocaldaceae archaeon]
MSWEVFNIRFRIESPIHIGHYTIGILKKTRYYILGKNMWGAITEKLALNDNNHNFRKIGEIVANNLIFSYLYLEDPKNGKLLKPRFTNDGLKYGNYNVYEFEKRFIRSLVSTAIQSDTMSAERESLHETEFISNREIIDEGIGNELYLSGYLFAKEYKDNNYNIKIENQSVKFNGSDILDDGKYITTGGERKYGFGRLEFLGYDKCNHKFETENNKLIIQYKKGDSIEAHLIVNDKCSIKGELELLVGREYGNSYGNKYSSSQLTWIPGSILEDSYRLEICRYGILKACI